MVPAFFLLLVIVVVVPRVLVRRPGIPGFLHLGERQHRLAPGPLRGGAQQRGALCVHALEPVQFRPRWVYSWSSR